jgi:hypothetical protein
MAISPFDLKKDAEHFKEDDSGGNFQALTKQPSSPSIKLEPFRAGPQYAKSLKENPWARNKLEALTLVSKERIPHASM